MTTDDSMHGDLMHGNSMKDHRHPNYGQLATGLAMAAAGVVFWLDLQGRIDAGELRDYWPLVLVAIGLGKLWDGGRRSRSGVFLIALGTLFQLDVLHVLQFREAWPLLLVVIGGLVAWSALAGDGGRRRRGDGAVPESQERRDG